MLTLQEMPVHSSSELMSVLALRTRQRGRELLRRASCHFGVAISDPSIRFNLRGKTAGQVSTLDGIVCIVRYNPQLLARNPEDFLAATVPHEVAHVVAFRLFGLRVRPHGPEWQSIMHLFHAEPRRCHDYQVDDLQTRYLRRYHYRCRCRSHSLTSIRHNRIAAGRIYICRHCGYALEPASEPD